MFVDTSLCAHTHKWSVVARLMIEWSGRLERHSHEVWLTKVTMRTSGFFQGGVTSISWQEDRSCFKVFARAWTCFSWVKAFQLICRWYNGCKTEQLRVTTSDSMSSCSQRASRCCWKTVGCFFCVRAPMFWNSLRRERRKYHAVSGKCYKTGHVSPAASLTVLLTNAWLVLVQ